MIGGGSRGRPARCDSPRTRDGWMAAGRSSRQISRCPPENGRRSFGFTSHLGCDVSQPPMQPHSDSPIRSGLQKAPDEVPGEDCPAGG